MDYTKMGLKCGLEIHQQLKTHKLFCNCPSKLRNDAPSGKVKRKLRARAGETGEIDVAALYESKKDMDYFYEVYNKSTCLVELDESPPREINPEALEIGFTVAKMLNCVFPSMLQVMRKTVLDGSNTSGFQRTMLIGLNGYINTPSGRVSIDTVCLEEDSARRTDEGKGWVTYRLDRLGIPLIEVATGPDIKTPEQAKEVAKAIGDILRSTGRTMRGLGTIRQDVNVSIKKGNRVEIKGVQDLDQIPNIIEEEVKRQQWLVNSERRVTNDVRNALANNKSKFLRPMPGASRMYPETDHPFITVSSEHINKIKLPELLGDKTKRYHSLGLSKDLAMQMGSSELSGVFDKLVKNYKNISATLIATTILSTAKDIKRKLNQEEGVFSEEHFEGIFSRLSKNKISKDAIPNVMLSLAKGNALNKTLARFRKLTKQELNSRIATIKSKNPKLEGGALIGKVMSELKGLADGKDIINLLRG